MPTTVKTGWLKDKNGDKFAPKTLTSQVQTSDGVLLEDKIKSDLATAKEDILENVAIEVDTALQSYTETDPTVPSWAKASTKPTYTKSEIGLSNVDNVKQYSANNPPPYPVTKVNNRTGAVSLTASDVGADASGTASSQVSSHNTNTSAHNDIRTLITGLTNRLNALANSDDTTLDQLNEIVAYIKNNKSLIDSVTTNKVNVSDIINNLTTNVSNKPLSAAQGVELKSLIDLLNNNATTTSAGLMSAADKIKLDSLENTPEINLEGIVTEDELFAMGYSDTLTWDGNTDGREPLSGILLYKVGEISDEKIIEIINNDFGESGVALPCILKSSTGSTEETEITATIEDAVYGMMCYTANGMVVIANSAFASYYGGTSGGIYYSNNGDGLYVSELQIPGVNFVEKKVINPDLLQIDLDNINTTTDMEMSDTSTNPVQNKVIKAYVDSAIEAAIGAAIAASY